MDTWDGEAQLECGELGVSPSQAAKVPALRSAAMARTYSPASKPTQSCFPEVAGQAAQRRRMEEFDDLWNRFSHEEAPRIISSLSVKSHGGLHCAEVAKLWGPGWGIKVARCLYALQVVAFVCCNVYYICSMDVRVLTRPHTAEAERFLIGKWFTQEVLGWIVAEGRAIRGEYLAICMELALLALLLSHCAVCALLAVSARTEPARWRATEQFLFRCVPLLSMISAVRLLYFVIPSVLWMDITLQVEFFMERWRGRRYQRALAQLLGFVVLRILCLGIGLDAFLVKFRETSVSINQTDLTWANLLEGVAFLFQVTGAVNLAWFTRKRLFIFIFGGENGVITNRDKALEYFWNAMLAKKVRQTFSFPTYLIIMLSFSDYDFQQLMLRTVPTIDSLEDPTP